MDCPPVLSGCPGVRHAAVIDPVLSRDGSKVQAPGDSSWGIVDGQAVSQSARYRPAGRPVATPARR